MKKAKFMLLPLLLMVVAMFFGCENTADNHSGATNSKTRYNCNPKKF